MTVVLALLRRVPLWAWLVLAMAAYVAHLHWRAAQSAQEAADALARATAAESAANHLAAARDTEAALNAAARKVTDDYQARLAHTRRTADAVRDERARLLVAVDQAAAAGTACPSAAPASAPDGAAGLRVVVGQCAAALSQVAEAADACDARLSGLQAYVRATIGAGRSD